ncbi:MAG: hypothetical protein KJN79_09305 [Gammaproteobacteria bacterium]|nr:hypothetical protein [Gammaproteobacteria bacterium]
MALNVADLQSGILGSLALGVAIPPANAPSDTIAVQMASSIDSYAKGAQTCAGTPLTAANMVGLEDGMKDALLGANPDGQAAAEKWLLALEAYWLTAAFGVTGAVIARPGGPGLVLALASAFDAKPAPPAIKPPGDAALAIATAIDNYTRAITAADTAGPCGPAPIM